MFLNWKTLINPDANKPVPEVFFSRKEKTQNHPDINSCIAGIAVIKKKTDIACHRNH